VRTTHLAIGAYPDDIEFMAATPIPECFQAFVQEHIQYYAQDVSDRLNFLK
jgi:hypothetical protein